ncbi:non-ribosomal peptide synthetase [Flavobacterium collinsii]|uniref:D-alanine--D-alanyl carrier protein ligase n=1 Tax=Flavobacterium collinsii TaxID=1114861 RepID=A0ABM8KP37_9FLAO|nr:non-ribosomal peptide synthetase [Flavobacterium collinsii]CAA9202368.1 D-alanine--D-alanyl carrier protein ligase [Flavobacterium collinsii]
MDIAIIGVSIKCSQVNNIEDFRRVLKSEQVCIGQPSDERIINSRIDKKELYYPYGYIDRNDFFDHSFFNLSKAEADAMDPAHRMLLESVCEALENSGYNLDYLSDRKAGLFTTAQSGGYNILYQSPNSELDFIGGLSAMGSGRIAYSLNISGSVMNIDTACSSSLVATHEAVQKLKNNELDIAVVGGTRILYQFNEPHELKNDAIMTADGQCRAFDDGASGTSGGEGVAVIILKRLDKAIEDKDNILTVIKGSAINHDGNTSNGITAPSPTAQTSLLLSACENGNVPISSIGYIETHGTGTKLGDPIEYRAIKDAFSSKKEEYSVRLGTLKPNIGHLDNLSGLVGLIKASLTLKEKEFFPLANFNSLNKFIDQDPNIIVHKEGNAWLSNTVRRAGVSSFGLSGTNSHVILEEYVPQQNGNSVDQEAEVWFKISAKNKNVLGTYLENISNFLSETDNSEINDIAFTLNDGRLDYKYGVSVHGKSVAALKESLLREKQNIDNLEPRKHNKIAFLFLSDEIKDLKGLLKDNHFDKYYAAEKNKLDTIGFNSLSAQTVATQVSLYHCLTSKGFSINNIICNGALAKVSKEIIEGKSISLPNDISFSQTPDFDLEKLKVLAKRLEEENTVLVIVGNNEVAIEQINQTLNDSNVFTVDLLKDISNGWGALWSTFYNNGIKFNWKSFYPSRKYNRKGVPTYPFEKNSCWNSIKNPLIFENKELKRTVLEKVSSPKAINEEEAVVSILQEVLQNKTFQLTDDFFELGGNSIVGIQFINRINELFQINIEFDELFNCYEINDIIELVKNEKNKEEKPSVIVEQNDINELHSFELSNSQKRMWVESQTRSLSLAYNIIMNFTIEGDINMEIFKEVLKIIVKDHHSLRAVFSIDENGAISQKIIPFEKFNFEQTLEFEHISELKSIESKVQEIYNTLFNLESGPLFRAHIIQINEHKNQVIFSFHHIIFDGWSAGIFMSDFVAIYKQLVNNTYKYTEKKESYLDYITWVKQNLIPEKIDSYRSYLKAKLENINTRLNLGNSNVSTFNGRKLSYVINSDISSKLNKIAQKNRATLFAVLLASVRVYLYRLTQDNCVIGTPVSGRVKKDFESIIGLFVNTIPFYAKVSDEKSFERCIIEEMESVTKALEHQVYPFDMLLEDLQMEKGTSLFDVMVILQNQNNRAGLINDGDVPFKIEMDNEQEDIFTRFNLTFTFFEGVDTIELELQYNIDVFDSEFIDSLLDNFLHFMAQILESPEQNVSKHSIVNDKHQKKLLLEFNDTVVIYPEEKTLIDLFEDQAKQTPENIAVVFDDLQITYKELNEKSNQLACYLRENYAIQTDDLVGVKLERSEKIIITILGILKSGAAYVPIDINYPDQRIAYIEKDSNSKIVIDEKEFFKFNKSCEKYSKDYVCQINTPNDLAYIIYTSGTTGEPKGVMIEHTNAVELINWAKSEFDSSKFDIMYAVTSHCFDLSVYEMFYAFSIGKKVRVLNNALFIKNHIEGDTKILLNTVPSVVRKLLEEAVCLDNVSYINMAGEILPVDIVKKLQSFPIEVRNLYGPSEDTTYSTNYVVLNKEYSSIPIGKPISNSQLYILDDDLRPVPLGVSGKLYVSGAGVARGYLNKPELTKEKFIANPFRKESRMYDTGDLGKWLSDGNVEFQGRKDHQVKIRGFRIELGEIENTILGYSDSLKEVVVEAKENKGEKVLVAYLVSSAAIDKSEVRKFLQEKLPDYMVPGFYVELENLPLTPNGKIDRKALPNVGEEDIIRKEYVAPENKTEEKLVSIWQEVLNVSHISVTDNFFELGGQSILAVKAVAIVNREFNTDYPLNILFHVETIKELSSYIINGYDFKKDFYEYGMLSAPKTVFAFPPILGYGTAYKNLFHDIVDVKVIAFNFLDGIENIVGYYANQINKLQHDGDIVLFGWSAGGNLSYEVANYLHEKLDRKVSSIIMLDSYAAHEDDPEIESVSDVDEYIKYDLGLQKLYQNDNILQKAKEKLFHYLKYMYAIEYKHKIFSEIYLIKSDEPMAKYNWENFVGKIHLVQGKGDHYSMLQEESFLDNRNIIHEIISKIIKI